MLDRRHVLVLPAAFALVGTRSPFARQASVFDLTVPDIDGGTLDIGRFAGGPLLVVNTASMCGFTSQYGQLQALWERYRDRGLGVIGVPSQDFEQEYGRADEVKSFCEVNFGIDFPLAAISPVRGPDAHPVFALAVRELGAAAAPRWNFHKVLFAPDGRARAAFPSSVGPDDPRIVRLIEDLLPEERA